jgi:uncharacterized 2Fe-2S/4Fe-4S cluster protein (DUF4445 family)
VKICGRADPPSASDKKLIPAKMLKQGYRLACQYRVTHNIGAEIPQAPATGSAKVGGTTGLALDIGTTVMKGALVDLDTKEVLKIGRIYNPQNEFGGDVMTRIGITLLGQYRTLRQILMDGIREIKDELGAGRPEFTVVTGNPVMTSFFLGKSVQGLARYPYKSAVSRGIMINQPKRYVFGSIGGFVGGDTIAGILASGLLNNRGVSLYIDLGTNGEIALVTKKRILALSTAAGPAFEGAGLKCGSLAIPGAIDRIEHDGGFSIHTINDRKPKGICASGLIDLLAALLKSGCLNQRGKLLKRVTVQGIEICQDDIRKLQLAIGAIKTGIQVLLEQVRIHPLEIIETVITGEFGSSLNIASLKRAGIIPDSLSDVRLEKDLPLRGGIMTLFDRKMIGHAENTRRISRHVELAMDPDFQKKFLNALELVPWS